MARRFAPPELDPHLQQRHFRPKKRLGQHFLIAPAWQRKVVEAIELHGDETVVELGAGWGALTVPLLAKVGRLVAIEYDAALSRMLQERLGRDPRCEVITGDCLKVRWDRGPDPVIVGAIPYHLTAPILERIVTSWPQVRGVWLIIQREVAARLTARPGTKAYGRLTCFVAYRYQTTRCFDLPPRAFAPPPEVVSTLVRLVPRPTPAVAVEDEAQFFQLIACTFRTRRKTIANGLRRWAPSIAKAEHVQRLTAAGVDPHRRPETLTLEEFARLARQYR